MVSQAKRSMLGSRPESAAFPLATIPLRLQPTTDLVLSCRLTCPRGTERAQSVGEVQKINPRSLTWIYISFGIVLVPGPRSGSHQACECYPEMDARRIELDPCWEDTDRCISLSTSSFAGFLTNRLQSTGPAFYDGIRRHDRD